MPFLMRHTAAIFVSYTQVLASIRTSGNHENVRIKIPLAEVLIHSFYICSAEKYI